MRRLKILVMIFIFLIGMAACQKNENEEFLLEQVELENEQANHVSDNIEMEEYLFVYVCGAVNREGVYELPVGSRVYEAIAAAGGFREDADRKEVNQAELLRDEERIYVPAIGEVVLSGAQENGKINLNKATKEELMTLPGVGESRAISIIKYREEQGPFQKIEDIMCVSGIKEGLFEKIRELIIV